MLLWTRFTWIKFFIHIRFIDRLFCIISLLFLLQFFFLWIWTLHDFNRLYRVISWSLVLLNRAFWRLHWLLDLLFFWKRVIDCDWSFTYLLSRFVISCDHCLTFLFQCLYYLLAHIFLLWCFLFSLWLCLTLFLLFLTLKHNLLILLRLYFCFFFDYFWFALEF